jgi:hypothetical protein
MLFTPSVFVAGKALRAGKLKAESVESVIARLRAAQ